MSKAASVAQFARVMFGRAELGDRRRTMRVVQMTSRIAAAPSGRVSSVFKVAAERQAAYDVLEHEHVGAECLIAAAGDATARIAATHPLVFVPIDGSSVRIVDKKHGKDFGVIGPGQANAPGLKVISGVAIDGDGAMLGVLAQQWWARTPKKGQSESEKATRNKKRRTPEKETRRWLDVIADVRSRCEATGAVPWIQIDREGDARTLLVELSKTDGLFTVRSSWNRRLWTSSGDRVYLAEEVERSPVVAIYDVNVPGSSHRRERVARMCVRALTVELRLLNSWTKTATRLRVTVVDARESKTAPRGEQPLHWRLLTNYPVEVDSDLLEVIRGYTQRWRIEDFHRTWKSGACSIEDTQLRSKSAVIKWATMLAAVATRIERLKRLARTQPDVSASLELSAIEIRALILIKRKEAKRTEKITDDLPTIETAVRWIADLGGYTGKSSGGPPGATVIARGLERVALGAELLAALDEERRR